MVGPLLLAAPPIVICLCTVFSGAGDDSRGGGTGTNAPWGGSCGSRHSTSDTANLSEGAGFSVSAHSLASSAGRGCDDGRLNAFLAAAGCARCCARTAPAPASVGPSAAVRGLMQVFRAVSTLAVLVKLMKMLQPAVSMFLRLGCRALFCGWICCLSGHEPWAVWCCAELSRRRRHRFNKPH